MLINKPQSLNPKVTPRDRESFQFPTTFAEKQQLEIVAARGNMVAGVGTWYWQQQVHKRIPPLTLTTGFDFTSEALVL